MKFTPVDKEKLYYKTTKLFDVLKEFAESEYTAVRIDDHHYKSAQSAQSTINKSVQRFGLTNIHCISRSGQIYLIKEI